MEIISHGQPAPAAWAEVDPEVARLRAELGAFELGRFLLANLGLNGHWTSYVLLFPERGRHSQLSSDGTPLTELEDWFLNRCPILLATQERFRLFRELTQPLVRAGMKLASLPSGLMDDLLTLDYTQTPGVELTAVDLDAETLREARANHQRLNPGVPAAFEQRDAWQLGVTERWDLLTSNGLNIYVQDDDLCTAFYRGICGALRPDGVFILSFITPPEQWRPYRASDLELQRLLFQEAMPARWNCFREECTTRDQLAAAGFEVLTVRYDAQRMFPAVVARKRPTGQADGGGGRRYDPGTASAPVP